MGNHFHLNNNMITELPWNLSILHHCYCFENVSLFKGIVFFNNFTIYLGIMNLIRWVILWICKHGYLHIHFHMPFQMKELFPDQFNYYISNLREYYPFIFKSGVSCSIYMQKITTFLNILEKAQEQILGSTPLAHHISNLFPFVSTLREESPDINSW